MKLVDYRSRFVHSLESLYDQAEAESFFYLLLEQRLNLKRIDLALDRERSIDENEQAYWNDALDQLQNFVPIQYIIGIAHFFGLEFEVNPSVLIPRPETEELVQLILDNHKNQHAPLKILDLCTGSGCIAIALAKNLPNAAVFAIDISESALETARRNAVKNEVSVTFLKQDLLAVETLESNYDIIVSNPPYLRELEKEMMRANVLEHEPHLALFVPDQDALIFYNKIAGLAVKSFNSKGELYFEINQYLGKETMDLLEQKGFSQLELHSDIYGNNRMIFARV